MNSTSLQCIKHLIYFKNEKELQEHTSECERLMKANICLHTTSGGISCKRVFNETASLIIHYLLVHGKNACSSCYGAFTTAEELETHSHCSNINLRKSELFSSFIFSYLTFSLCTEPFQCDQCHTSFASQQYLNVHVSNKHRRPTEPKTLVKRYQCKLCCRSYALVQSLMRHARMNHGLNCQETRDFL